MVEAVLNKPLNNKFEKAPPTLTMAVISKVLGDLGLPAHQSEDSGFQELAMAAKREP